MKFKIEPHHTTLQLKLSYLPEEYSFDVESAALEVDFDLAVNYLTLTVIDGKIVQVSGFCPYGAWIKSNHAVPKFTKGKLKVIDSFEPGFSYRINDIDWPTYVNINTGWICVGNPTASQEGVEFMENCVAIIDNSQLVALWLKPVDLPTLLD